MRKLIFLFFLIAMISACDTPGTYMGHEDMKKPYVGNGYAIYPQFIPLTPAVLSANIIDNEYRVGPQDILTIIVWNHPELTIPSMQTTSENVNIYTSLNQSSNNPPGILVNENGTIFFPLAGNIHVADSTVEEIRMNLTRHLRKYIRNPQVSVRVSAFRNKPVYVIGEVMKSGIQYITDMPLTILDAINQAGGIDRQDSDTHYIYVIRGNHETRDILRPVFGVRRALDLAYERPCVFWLDASSPTAILMATQFRLKARDVVMVSTAGVARYARLINRILPTIQTITNQPVRFNDPRN